ncbi:MULTISPECIES: sulfur carrier protein ThiS [Caproicibacterium]|uniref:Sulfur carrier protein ThiS n=1 Tax=Caproicibacterium argilliputei TaxID=3030016 RepID=A0AA97DAF7_9FIRM|nr:sulfur carrier protein ThiS [Caproicibacterium argilliputei]WOC33214.1 sulfur carrier protein ThiS [Caproicibacterium argilliputei]
MQILLNGKLYPCEQNATLLTLLEQLQMPPQAVVAELSGQIIKAECFAETVLHEGDTLELLRFVGGG